jgi:uncharacterized protein (TIGR00251 family)
VRVSPGGSRAQVVGRRGEAWKLRVAAPPEDGKANDAVLRLLAETLELPRRDVALLSGHGARDKVVLLDGIGAAETERRLATAAAGRGKGTA